MENKKKTGYLVAGATMVLASSALILDFAIRKRAKKAVMAAGVLVGIAGIAAGVAVASYPKVDAVKKLNTNKLFDIDDIDLMDKLLLAELGEEEDEFVEAPVTEAESTEVVATPIVESEAIELPELKLENIEAVEPAAQAEAVETIEVANAEVATPVVERDNESIDDLTLEINFEM